MNPIISTTPSPIPDNSQRPFAGAVETAPLLPPRKTALPYTGNEYRLLPDGEKTAILSFLLEGKTAAEFYESLHLDITESEDAIESANRAIIEWCVTNDEPDTLEFFFERNPKADFIIDAKWPGDKLISVATKVLDVHPTLGVSVISHSFEPSTYPFLCELISDSRAVYLDMDMSEASEADLLQFMKAMRTNLSVSTAFISGMALTEEAEAAFAFVLADHRALSTLHIEDSDFGPTAGANIFGALAGNKTLKCLFLDHVRFSTGYEHGLGSMLEKNNTLMELAAVCQNFGPNGVKHILTGAQKNSSLRKLALKSEINQPDHALELAKFIALNNSVTDLLVTCDPLNEDEKTQLLLAVDGNKFLCNLRFFSEDNQEFLLESLEQDADYHYIYTVLRENDLVRQAAIRNAVSQNFSNGLFDSRVYLPEEPAQMVIDNLWQLSPSLPAFQETARSLQQVVGEVIKEEEKIKAVSSQAKPSGSSDMSAFTDASSSSSGERKDS